MDCVGLTKKDWINYYKKSITDSKELIKEYEMLKTHTKNEEVLNSLQQDIQVEKTSILQSKKSIAKMQ